MSEPTVNRWPTPYRIAGEAFGVRVRVSTDTENVMTRIEQLLPPGWTALDPDDFESTADEDNHVPHYTLITHDGLEYVFNDGDTVVARSDLGVVLGVFDSHLRSWIALRSPGRVFVHAGVVGHGDRAIVLPGPSFSGKTTLVAELVRMGAVYYSDEYAVLDADGLVHPYPKPLSIRVNDYTQVEHHAETLGGTLGDRPLRIGLVVLAQYRTGGRWEPRTLSSGEAVLALLANTVPAQERPEETLEALRRAVVDAEALEGERGDAGEVASALLTRVAT